MKKLLILLVFISFNIKAQSCDHDELEMAVMIDTYQHLFVTEQALQIEDPKYMASFLS